MKKIIFLTLFLFAEHSWGEEFSKSCKSSNYETAMKSDCFLKFAMESTKAGILTTGFTGVVKDFKTVFSHDGREFSSVVVTFKIKDMDTDNSSRDGKMHYQSFASEKFAVIRVDIPGPLKLGKNKDVDAIMKVRGKDKRIKLDMDIVANEDQTFKVSGRGAVGLKALGIPDPNIWIASVRDRVDLSFQVKGNFK